MQCLCGVRVKVSARRREGMTQQDHQGRLRVGKRRRHRVKRRACHSRKAWIGDKCG